MAKTKFPFEQAIAIAQSIEQILAPACDRIIIAGSLRRQRPAVGDIEILYIPKYREIREGLFDTALVNEADEILTRLLDERCITKRRNEKGSEMWGDKNKFARHEASGIPVDFFSACEACWFNYLVCRTGPSESNIRIAAKAKDRRWKWRPYGSGFQSGQQHWHVSSEREVFDFLELPYLEPKDR